VAEVLGERGTQASRAAKLRLYPRSLDVGELLDPPRSRACEVPSQTQSELSHFFFAGAGNLNLPKETAKTAKRVKPS